MTLLDKIREFDKEQEKAKNLCASYQYSPDKIGAAILEACGYNVKFHLKGEVSVTDQAGNVLYYGG